MDFEAGKGAALALDALRVGAPDPRRRAQRRGGGRVVRRHHLREGRRGAAHARGVPGRGPLPRRHPPLHAAAPRGATPPPTICGARSARRRGSRSSSMANGWIRQTGLSAGQRVAASATRQRTSSTLTPAAVLRRSRARATAARPDALAGAAWCCASATRRASRSSRCCCARRRRDVSWRPRARSSWCLGNAEARGFYRDRLRRRDAARGCCRRSSELRPAERLALVSDQWALVRAGQAPIEAFLDLVASLRGETDHVVLDELVGRLSVIEHRFLADEDRAALRRVRRRAVRRARREARLAPPRRAAEDDETRLRRAVLLRALVLLARDPDAVAEAETPPAAPPARTGATSTPTCWTSSSPPPPAAPTRRASRSCAARAQAETDPAGQAALPARAGARRVRPRCRRAPSSWR